MQTPIKTVTGNSDLHAAIKAGASKIANIVGSTMGALGANVIDGSVYGYPDFTKDGAKVANGMFLEDKIEDLACQTIKNACLTSNKNMGDGTTATVVIANSLIQNTIGQPGNPHKTRKKLESLFSQVSDYVMAHAKPCNDKETLKKIALISANGNEEIAEIAASVVDKIGCDGFANITTTRSNVPSYYNIMNGYAIKRGASQVFYMNTEDKNLCKLEDAVIVSTDDTIYEIALIEKILKYCHEKAKSFVFLCGDIRPEVESMILININKGAIRGCVIKGMTPDEIEEAALCLGGIPISRSKGMSLRMIDPSSNANDVLKLGTAENVTISYGSSIFVGNGGNRSEIEKRIAALKGTIDLSETQGERETILEKIARIDGKGAKIVVGGGTDQEAGEKYDLMEDAFRSCQAAYDKGVVPGGGITILKAAIEIPDDGDSTTESFKKACQSTARKIIENAVGDEKTNEYVDSLIEKNTGSTISFGYDVREILEDEEPKDMESLDIIDPASVVIQSLKAAVTAACLLLTTKYAITETVKE